MAQNVKFIKGDTAKINGTAITDGQLLYNTTTGQHYIDNGSTRVEVGKLEKPEKPVVNTTAEVLAITEDNIPCGTKPVKELIENFGTLKFGIDADGNAGYIKAGADSVTPFKNCPDYECSIRGYNSGGYHGIIINNLCVKNYNRIRIVSQNSSWGQYPNKGKNMGNNTWDITDADYISFDLQTSGSASSSVYQTYRLYNE